MSCRIRIFTLAFLTILVSVQFGKCGAFNIWSCGKNIFGDGLNVEEECQRKCASVVNRQIFIINFECGVHRSCLECQRRYLNLMEPCAGQDTFNEMKENAEKLQRIVDRNPLCMFSSNNGTKTKVCAKFLFMCAMILKSIHMFNHFLL